MKKTISLFFAPIMLFLTGITFLSPTPTRAQSPNPLFHHLPPKADHIYDIDFAQLNAKGNLAAVLGGLPMGNDPKAGLILSLIKDPAAAGVDLSNHIIVANTSASDSAADTLSFTNIVVRLSDSAKFRKTLTQAIPGLHLHHLPGKGFTAAKERTGLAWNDRVVIITLASKSPLSAASESPAHGTHPASHRTTSEIVTEKSLAALAGFSESPWTTDQRFLTGFATDADVHFWSTGMSIGKFFMKMASKFAGKGLGASGMPMPNTFGHMYDGFAHTPILSSLNFASGRIVFQLTYFNGPDRAAMMKRFLDRPFNKDLFARLPDGRLLGWMTMHMNLNGYDEMLDQLHTRHMLDSILGKVGLSINDITAPFNGDFLVAAIAPDSVSTTDTAKKKVNFYFVAGLADPSKLMALTAKFSGASSPLPDSAKEKLAKGLADKVVIRDNLLVISGSHEQAMKYFDHPGHRPTDQIADNAMQNLVIDLKAVSGFLGASMTSDPKAMIFARILEKLDRITLTNGVMDGNNTGATFQIVTAEPSTNSLATLMSILH